jgi:hypothetical protein
MIILSINWMNGAESVCDGGERVGDAACPEFVPELVDLGFQCRVILQHG